MKKEEQDLFGLVFSLRHVGSRLEQRPVWGEALAYAEGISTPIAMFRVNGREVWGFGAKA